MLRTLLPLVLLPLALPAQPAPPPLMFAVRLTTGPAWDATKRPGEQEGMKKHGANIARMRREGVLVLGARYGDTGLMVFRVPDEAAARAQFDSDPTIAAGVFKMQVDVFSPFAHGNTAWLMTPEAIVLRAYLDASNRLDAAAVTALCAENFTWYNVEGDQAAPEVQGRTRLLDWLNGYYRNIPSARSEFLALEQAGPFLTVRERASWDSKEGKRVSQQALGIYEIRDGLIQRVWYYPAAKDELPAQK